MTKPFRLGIVGTGLITRGSHLPAALASTLVDVTALVDPVLERAAELARQYAIKPRLSTRISDVLQDLDGALIATPNDTHAPLAIECLGAGVSTLIEKPLASSVAEGRAILQAAQQSDCVVAVGYSSRFRNNVAFLKRLLDEKQFGTARRFVHQFGTAGGWAPLSAYNLDRRSAGGGVLVVTGTHFIDRMLYFWGYPDEAHLEDDSLGGPEANCCAKFGYSSNGLDLTGVARYSKTVKLPAGLVVETERGYLLLYDTDDAAVVFRPHAQPGFEQVIRLRRESSVAGDVSVFQLQLENFVRACRGEETVRVDARQGLESLRLIDHLYTNRRQMDLNYYATNPAVQS